VPRINGIKSIPAVLLIIMLLASFTLPPVHAQENQAKIQAVFINYTQKNNTITVNTPFYKLTINGTAGGITWLQTINDEGGSYDAISGTDTPLLSIGVPKGNTSEIIVRNLTAKVSASGNNSLIITLNGSDKGVSVSMSLLFNSWTPVIDIMVSVSGTEDYILNLPVLVNGENTSINTVYRTLEGSNFTTYFLGIGANPLKGDPLSLAHVLLYPGQEKTRVALFAGLKFIDNKPYEVDMEQVNASNTTQIRKTMIYFKGNTLGHITGVFTNYVPAVLLQPEFTPLLASSVNVSKDLGVITSLNKYLNKINNTISTLRNRIKALQNQTANLTRQLDNYKGCEDHYKQELLKKDHDVEALQERLKRAGALNIAVFFIGIILGLIGGLYVVKIRR
jgi:flagellin-like hook-associated protein FlgL